jgi:nucleoside-triphosphatase
MKLLITGLPGTGKTTLIKHLIAHNPQAFWVVSAEIRDEHGNRIGFEAKTSAGVSGVFAHKHTINSDTQIGDYRVDTDALDKLFTRPITKSAKSAKLLIVDEIGRMQMLSSSFAHTMRKLFEANCDVVATIRYGDDWTAKFTGREDVITVVLTSENREQAKVAIEAMLGARPQLSSLTNEQQKTVARLARKYAHNNELIQLRKLYKNAVRYVAEKRIEPEDNHKFKVKGDHGAHLVVKGDGGWTCDCALFNGRGQFANQAGECSHIQAATLFLAR